MAIRWKDFKERALSLLGEFRGQRVGIIGLGIIIFIFLVGLFAPWLAPNTNGQWNNAERWRDFPQGAPPEWVDYFTSDDLAPHTVQTSPTDNTSTTLGGGRYEQVTLNFNYSNDYDLPPRDIVLYLYGSFSNQTQAKTIDVTLTRPDDREIQLINEQIQSNGTFGPSGTGVRYSLIRSPTRRDILYNFGAEFVEGELPPKNNVKPSEVMFGKANENILSFDPDPLKGEYTFTVTFTSDDINIEYGEDKSRMIYLGRTYGWMGTDDSGRDIGLAWAWGARYALLLGAIVAGTTVTIGTVYGMTSAYFGGWTDEIMQRVNEIVIGIPILPILIIIMFMWKQSFWVMVLLMSILYWRGIAKTIRARGLQIRQSTFVEAAQSLGSSGGRVITTHMIPQILPYSVAEAALLVPIVIITEASLSVLGLGDPSLVTWGKLLSQANSAGATVQGLWWWVLLPGFGITLLGFAFIATGMAIERVVNPKMRQR